MSRPRLSQASHGQIVAFYEEKLNIDCILLLGPASMISIIVI